MNETEAPAETQAEAPTEYRFTTQADGGGETGTSVGKSVTARAAPVTHRVARLFVAGTFPDKNITVSEADLDELIARFHQSGARRPVQIEHIVSPLDPLGEVVGLHRSGPELFGLLVFSEGMEAHLKTRGVENVSVALVRDGESGFSLKEVSLVLKGRIPSATLLHEADSRADFGEMTGETVRVEFAPTILPTEPEAGIKKGDADTAEQLARFRANNKLTPATESLAAILLGNAAQNAPVSFSAENDEVTFAYFADVFAQFLDALPPVYSRAALAPVRRSSSGEAENAPVDRAASAMAARFGVAPRDLAARLK